MTNEVKSAIVGAGIGGVGGAAINRYVLDNKGLGSALTAMAVGSLLGGGLGYYLGSSGESDPAPSVPKDLKGTDEGRIKHLDALASTEESQGRVTNAKVYRDMIDDLSFDHKTNNTAAAGAGVVAGAGHLGAHQFRNSLEAQARRLHEYVLKQGLLSSQFVLDKNGQLSVKTKSGLTPKLWTTVPGKRKLFGPVSAGDLKGIDIVARSADIDTALARASVNKDKKLIKQLLRARTMTPAGAKRPWGKVGITAAGAAALTDAILYGLDLRRQMELRDEIDAMMSE